MLATSAGTSRAAACPWAFLCPLEEGLPHPQPIPKAKTFASVLSNSVESSVSLSELPAPVIRGDKTYVKINEALYQYQLKIFKTNLIGRLLLRKGSVPMKTSILKSLLADLWKPSTPWRLVPLGMGYFDIHFGTEEDLRRVWGGGTCTLLDGLFRLAQWKPDFVPGDVLPQTHAQLDKATKEREFGYYARVLVDVDLAGELPSSLMVERETHCFPIEIIYENMCTHCGMVGHMADRCRQLQGDSKPRNIEKPTRVPQLVVGQVYRVKEKTASKKSQTTEVQPLVETTDTNVVIPACAEVMHVHAGQDSLQVGTRNIEPIDNGRASSPGSTVRSGPPITNDNQFAILAHDVIVGAANDLIEQLADQVFLEPNDQSIAAEHSREIAVQASVDEGDSFPTSPIVTEGNAVVVQGPEDDVWQSVHFYGNPMFVLASKLQTLKQRIRAWSKTEFGDVNIMVENSFVDLDII
ncbi:uncharacterized protein LOC133716589 [Rosa rugosa]|uniref:uncharacterized protein LOC133716589 n=1 Tax=Rosa rugosa TaxID=74645 RepID=UPI002B409537|nr:uncharacterized protein LOC133716589 [Rosa rugosa]